MNGEFFKNKTPPAEDQLADYAGGPNGLVKGKPTRQRRAREEFIRGPFPVRWMAEAAQLPGPALAVALAIWHVHLHDFVRALSPLLSEMQEALAHNPTSGHILPSQILTEAPDSAAFAEQAVCEPVARAARG